MKWVSLAFVVMSVAVSSAQEKAGFDLNARGLDASARGDHAEAERLFREAGKVWRTLGPAYDAHMATTQTNLAQALSGQGKRREATDVLEAAVSQFRRSRGLENLH